MNETVNDIQKFETFVDSLGFEYSVDFNMSPGVDGSVYAVEIFYLKQVILFFNV